MEFKKLSCNEYYDGLTKSALFRGDVVAMSHEQQAGRGEPITHLQCVRCSKRLEPVFRDGNMVCCVNCPICDGEK